MNTSFSIEVYKQLLKGATRKSGKFFIKGWTQLPQTYTISVHELAVKITRTFFNRNRGQ
jgi:hypothetical protein